MFVFALAAIFGLFAVAFAFGFARELGRSRALASRGVMTGGIVVGRELDDGSSHPVVRYEVAGRPYERTAHGGSRRTRGLPLGEAVRVRYLPDAPEDASIDLPGELWGRTIGFGTLSGVCGVLAAAIAIGAAVAEGWIRF